MLKKPEELGWQLVNEYRELFASMEKEFAVNVIADLIRARDEAVKEECAKAHFLKEGESGESTEATIVVETIKRMREDWTKARKYDKADACVEILKAIKVVGY